MKKGINILVAIFVAVMLIVAITPISFADIATITQSFGTEDAQEINQALYSNEVTNLGTRLEGPLKRETSTYTTGGAKDFDVDDAVILFTTDGVSGTNDPSLANGKPGQLMTFVLSTDGGTNVDITPLTKTGFTSITLSDANDSCTIRYQDDTVGWVVAGNSGCTIN